MTKAQELDFCEFVRSTGDVVFLPRFFRGKDPIEITDIEGYSDEEVGRNLVIFNYSVCAPFYTRDVESQDYKSIDLTRSELIEFTRSHDAQGEDNSPGRLWIDRNTHDENYNAKLKSTEFLKWYTRLAKWLRSEKLAI